MKDAKLSNSTDRNVLDIFFFESEINILHIQYEDTDMLNFLIIKNQVYHHPYSYDLY